MKYQVELVWNREFDFVEHGPPQASLSKAIAYARSLESMGDGERVKKTRVLDSLGEIVWAYGKRIKRGEEPRGN